MIEQDDESFLDVQSLRDYFSSLKTQQPEGLSLNNFELGRTIGVGSFGRVRVVTWNPSTQSLIPTGIDVDRAFALKILQKSSILKRKHLQHVHNEVFLLLELNHPFITTLYTSFTDNANVYLVMEYIEGGELYSRLTATSKFPPRAARFYASEVALALCYLHSKNIIYRDLKPENVLIDSTGHVKLTDFGFAKRATNRTWTMCGTAEYIPPEMIISKGHSKPADWWAFGIFLYELLCGYTPFSGDNESETDIYQRILIGVIEFPKFVDPFARELIKNLCTADTTKRIGGLANGVSDVLNHKFFRNTDWEKVYQRKVPPPFVPPPPSHVGDTSNFEKYSEEEESPEGENVLTEADQDLFAEF